MNRIVFDVSNIIDIADGVKTGIPRVEFAIFDYLAYHYKGHVAFSVNKPTKTGFMEVLKDDIKNRKVHVQPRTLIYRLKKSILKRLGAGMSLTRMVKGGHFEPWQNEDCYLCVNTIWERISEKEYFSLRDVSGLKLVLFCHDLAPLVIPNLYPQIVRSNFSWCLNALSASDLVICNSFFTHGELINLAKATGLTVNSTVVQLSAEIECVASSADAPLEFLTKRRFILSVSSISARKNYDFLLKVWAQLRSCHDISEVCLVIVGSKAWGAEQVVHMLEAEPLLEDRVFHLSSVADDTLEWLYKNCMFTVYPSIYEGWGLPITESLSYGKVCVASSTTSMPEASQGFGVHIEPTNFIGWSSELKKLITDKVYRQALENNIKDNYHPMTWSFVAKNIILQLDTLKQELKF